MIRNSGQDSGQGWWTGEWSGTVDRTVVRTGGQDSGQGRWTGQWSGTGVGGQDSGQDNASSFVEDDNDDEDEMKVKYEDYYKKNRINMLNSYLTFSVTHTTTWDHHQQYGSGTTLHLSAFLATPFFNYMESIS